MIRVQELHKYFGAKRALGPVSFEIGEGETVGLLGLNGAGKTTALRVLACDLRPSAGSVRIDGVDALDRPHEVRKRIGYLPENPPVYGDMTVGDYLAFAGRLRGMSADAVAKRVPAASAVTHLEEVQDELIRNLSHGFRQRVGVAQAIVHEPKLLILDEPTRGLDPVQIVEMRQMIRDLKSSHTVLISSHILTEISETCDRLLVLGDGQLIGTGTEDELSAKLLGARHVLVGVALSRASQSAYRGDADAEEVTFDKVASCLRAVEGVSEVTSRGESEGALELEVESTRDVRADLCKALVAAKFDVVRLDRSRKQLETIFLQLVQGGATA
jgi:ABC-2 type transport system ATP-binding protein